MACQFPGAHSPEELWQNILAGRRYFRKAPPERLPPDYFDPDPDAPAKSYCDLIAVITDWVFDPVAFRIPPVTFQVTDIVHWLALDTAREAICNSGLRLKGIDRARVGVVLGNSLTGEFSRSHNLRLRWPYVERSIRRALADRARSDAQVNRLIDVVRQAYEGPLPEVTEDTLAGNMANTIAGRICNYFDFGGGGFTVDGACSSSLLSVTLACDALASGELDFALAGGVDVSLDPFEIVGFAKTRALTPDDIRPYDERASGMLTGEGCGVVVLARADNARAAGHTIHALIRGWGYSSDGTASGITAPEVEGQLRALRAAYRHAGYPIGTVGLIEGHGTGTSLGDRVELTAIRRLLEEAPGEGVCHIGSLKANIGHCKAAAGIAGMLKGILALERKILPPTVNCERPNAVFGRPFGRLQPSLGGRAWERGAIPRRASVSSMGFGGANAHLTLEEASPEAVASPDELALLGSPQSSELIVLAGETLDELQQQIERLLPVARKICRAELIDLSAALTRNPPQGRLRLALVVESPWALVDSLEACRDKLVQGADLAALETPAPGIIVGVARENPALVALFPGQGSQRLNMGEYWRRRFPFVREFYEQAARAPDASSALRLLQTRVFRDILNADQATRGTWEQDLRDTRVAQPAIVASSLAALQVLEFLGLRPAFAIGHSLGEITAMAAAGVCDGLTALRLAALRGEAMAALPQADHGGMAAVAAPAETVQKLIEPLAPAVVISNCNSPRQTVVSGSSDAIQRLAALCEARKLACRTLPVSQAFHSSIVAPASPAISAAIQSTPRFSLKAPRSDTRLENCGQLCPASLTSARMISTVTGQLVSGDVDWADYLAGQVRRPVRFIDAVLKAAEDRPALWIEVGPGGALCSFVRDIFRGISVSCLPTDLPGEDGFHLLNLVLARAWVAGFPVKLANLFAHRFCRPLDPWNYHPQFIVNPCERPVEFTKRAALNLADVMGPEPQVSAEQAANAAAVPVPANRGQTDSLPPDRVSLTAFATAWIAKRTGFPQSAVTSDKKLRDDLNLDSIKVGELVVLLTRKLGRRLESDPASFANARIAELVDAVVAQAVVPGQGLASAPETRPAPVPVAGLEDWVRTFHLETVPAPVTSAGWVPLPPAGKAVIVANAACPRAEALAHHLRSLGLIPWITNVESLLESGDAPSDLTVAILLLPEVSSSFLAGTIDDFDQRVEGLATTLFRVFRWAGHRTDTAKLRGLVVRPVTEGGDWGADLNAGGAFLKSLGLEYPGATFKWLTLPAVWTSEQWARVLIDELQVERGSVVFHYDQNGRRFASVAVCDPEESLVEGAPLKLPLGPDDVVLVSGGAKGITCELALELARATGVRLALLGSSAMAKPLTNGPPDELRRNLDRFGQRGIRHIYLQADVTDPEAVRRAVTAAQRELGPVTGILHGAGVTELRLFREKELDAFLRCVRIKARGLRNLLAAISPAKLKALHVVSSVLGQTGMRGQADYAFANAWLDGAVRAAKSAHPEVHCLSLGFTAWAETGLARKVGAVAALRAAGLTALTTQKGTAAYLSLARRSQVNGPCIITGSLGNELEAMLFAPPGKPRGRFLEQVRRWVPGVELIADAVLSHETDRYLPEHVFEGTPVFPGVMAMEAMAQASQACTGCNEWPTLRQIEFRQPLIVPDGARVVMRTLALVDRKADGAVRVRIVIRSDRDGFAGNHFEAECWFGLKVGQVQDRPSRFTIHDSRLTGVIQPAADLALPELLPTPLAEDPECFSPVPLFQGKFFRRISAIRELVPEQSSLTDIQVPVGERYFAARFEQAPALPCPAVQDACLQSGALILPPGCLPGRIDELHVAGCPAPGTTVRCVTRVREKTADRYVVDIATFDPEGKPLEILRGLCLKKTSSFQSPPRPASPLTRNRIAGDLQALLPGAPHSIALVDHSEVSPNGLPSEVSAEEIERISANTPAARRASVLANLVAARRASLACVRANGGLALSPAQIILRHRSDGKPELQALRGSESSLPGAEAELTALDVSLADVHGWSVALVGRRALGVDLERVERRDTETWCGLLGDDGYAVALRVAAQTGESFDCAGTRVWTLLEAGKKADHLQRTVPTFEASVGGPWLSFAGVSGETRLEFLSTTLNLRDLSEAPMVLSVAFVRLAPESPDRSCHEPGPLTPTLSPAGGESVRRTGEGGSHQSTAREHVRMGQGALPEEGAFRPLEPILAQFRSGMERLRLPCADDPAAGCELRHAEFLAAIEQTRARLKELEGMAASSELPDLRRRFQEEVLGFLDGSENFRHTLVKPLGYAGDYRLIEMIANNTCGSRGLAWHFDRAQLDSPAAEACRRRIEWISGELAATVKRRSLAALSVLDLGVGAGSVERHLLRREPGLTLDLHAVDLDPGALACVSGALGKAGSRVHPYHLNLREPASIPTVSQLAAQVDACIAIGILEALTDPEVVRLLRAVLEVLPAGAALYTESFLPTHPTRAILEWFQDFHLAYRSVDELHNLAVQAGASPRSLELKLDSTGSLALLNVTQ